MLRACLEDGNDGVDAPPLSLGFASPPLPAKPDEPPLSLAVLAIYDFHQANAVPSQVLEITS